ncbi:murein hydrolase activator EnvC family protein [Actinomadura viridis]|uniref:murein hydrolase activator EnvC family protein n=1 Tax=Actinomadura viridis TaxID=58110 RepID=UPI0036815D50
MTLLTLILTCALGAGPPVRPEVWRWPLGPPAPQVVRAFLPPSQPWGPGHRGVDLATRPGRPVYAAGAGRVSYAGRLAGRGIVSITHGPLRTTYLPVRPSVRKGHAVRAGTRIGTVEPSSHCPAACLHWGLLRGDRYLDPLGLVRYRTRLLPHWRSPSPTPPHSTPVPSRSTLTPSGGTREPAPRQAPRMGLRDATTAGTGALAGMLFAFTVTSLLRHGRTRRPPPPPPGVVDLARERRLRRAR